MHVRENVTGNVVDEAKMGCNVYVVDAMTYVARTERAKMTYERENAIQLTPVQQLKSS